MNPDVRSTPPFRPGGSGPTQHPRAFDRWVIPGAVLVSVALGVTVIVLLAIDWNRPTTTVVLAVFTAATIFTTATVLYIKEYVVHRALATDHQLLRDDGAACQQELVAELRALSGLVREALLAGDETRIALQQLARQQKEMRDLYWHDVADHISGEDGGGPIPFRRRRS